MSEGTLLSGGLPPRELARRLFIMAIVVAVIVVPGVVALAMILTGNLGDG